MSTSPKVALFDLDDTLAESFQPPATSMIDLLARLLERMPVAIVTAAGWQRIEHQFLTNLVHSPNIGRLFIMPNSSSECFTYINDSWEKQYDMSLSEDERQRIKDAIEEASARVNFHNANYAPRVIDRGPQVVYAAVGLDAPIEVKKSWDPDQSKRKQLKQIIEARVPDAEVLIGGMTTIDITKKGVSKAFGVKWLSEKLNIPTTEMLFVGDAFYPGGNDEVVIPTGIQVRVTSGPAETEKIILDILAK